MALPELLHFIDEGLAHDFQVEEPDAYAALLQMTAAATCADPRHSHLASAPMSTASVVNLQQQPQQQHAQPQTPQPPPNDPVAVENIVEEGHVASPRLAGAPLSHFLIRSPG